MKRLVLANAASVSGTSREVDGPIPLWVPVSDLAVVLPCFPARMPSRRIRYLRQGNRRRLAC
jgi:hypothetical protein